MKALPLFFRAVALASAPALLLISCACGPGPEDLPPPASATGADEFVDEVRQLSAEKGLPAARQYLVGALAERDDSNGRMESRLKKASADPDFVYSDSLAALPESERARIGIAFIPGMKAKGGLKPSKPVQALAAAAAESREMGFQARLIPAVSRGRISKNAAAMSSALAEVFAESDQVILLAKSKGAHDLIYYLRHQGAELPPEERKKLKAVCILAGTVQGSFVADWFANSCATWATSSRALLAATGRGAQIGMLQNVATSPWKGLPHTFPRDTYPNVSFINLVVLPDGEDGRSTGTVWSPFMREQIEKTAGWESPNDTLVETAAETLPEWVDAPQWIVRTSGSHAFPKGEYLDGSKVTPFTQPLEDGTLNPECGAEIMNAFLRSLPRSLLD
ncbi:MAG: hypothetical protein KDN19_04740 [Verrucomicrobiae bacterium]|nr:hypothetical protein [Verrucomicrobiae bacterium]